MEDFPLRGRLRSLCLRYRQWPILMCLCFHQCICPILGSLVSAQAPRSIISLMLFPLSLTDPKLGPCTSPHHLLFLFLSGILEKVG